jgi:hypothetical protein
MKIRTPQVTIAFTSHRIETIPYAKKFLKNQDVIITEEAPNPRFSLMLDKKIPIKTYIEQEHLEFPEFSKQYYTLLRLLHRNRKKILQIEPYMEKLMQIYDLFSNGKSPADVKRIPALRKVYDAERKATAALLNFYELSLSSHLPGVLDSVKEFARVDAERFRLRDSLRAQAISEAVTQKDKRVYIEAGGIHIYLEKTLKEKLGKRCQIKTMVLLGEEIQKLTRRKTFYPPGDHLTIHYILKKKANEEYETLLAIKSLIYIKLLNKNEMSPNKKTKTPHLDDELKVHSLIENLTLGDCEALYRKIRFLPRVKALKIAMAYRPEKPALR